MRRARFPPARIRRERPGSDSPTTRRRRSVPPIRSNAVKSLIGPRSPASLRFDPQSCTRELPAMDAGALVEIPLGHVDQVQPALAQQQPEVQGTGRCPAHHRWIEQVHAAGLELRLARPREVAQRKLRIRRYDPAFDMVGAELVARPARVVGTIARLDVHQPLTGVGATFRAGVLPKWQHIAPVTAIGTTGCGHRDEEEDPHPHVCQIGSHPPHPGEPPEAWPALERAHQAVDERHAQVEQRHAQQLVVEGRGARHLQKRVEPEHSQPRTTRRRAPCRCACAGRSRGR